MTPGGVETSDGWTRILGRDRELAELWDALDAPAQLGLRAVLVTGEAGIGKSTFLELLTESAALRRTTTTVTAAGGPVERQMPFAGLSQLLDSHPQCQHSREFASTRSLLAGERLASFGDVVVATVDLFSTLVDHGELLVVLDDMDEVDEDTLRVLELVCRRFARSAVALVMAAREPFEDPESATAPLLEQLGAAGRLRLLALQPLENHDVHLLAERIAGTTLTPTAVRWVADASRGNPFLAQMAAGCLSDELLDRIEDATRSGAVVGADLSSSRRFAILRRVLPLSASERRLARAMSAMTQVRLRDVDALARIATVDQDTADATFDSLVGAGVLEATADGFRFVHGLVREALYADIGPAERARLHREIAEHLLNRRLHGGAVDVTELALHVDAGELDDDRAGVILQAAGDFAGRTAPRTAIYWYRRALRRQLTDDQKAQTFAGLASAHFHALDGPACAAAATEAIALLPPGDARDQTNVMLSQVQAWSGDFTGALQTIESALRTSPSNPRLRSSRATLLAYLGCIDDAQQVADGALIQSKDTAHELGAHVLVAELANQAGDAARMLETLGEVERKARRESAETQLWLCSSSAHLYVMHGYLAEGRSVLERAATLASGATRNPYWGMTLVAGGLLRWLAGDWDGYADQADEAMVELEQAQHLLERSYLEVAMIEVANAQDQRRPPDPSRSPARGMPALDAVRAWAAAGTAMCEGRAEDGIGLLRPFADPSSPRRAVQLLVHARLAELGASGDVGSEARDAARILRELLRSDDGPFPRCAGLRGIAVGEADIDAAREAAAVAEDAGLLFELGQVSLVRGSLADDAPTCLAEAFSIFQRLGAAHWLRRTAAAMRAAGVPVPRRSTTGALSETEREVARLVQLGKTNREIALELAYSPKTIEVYLSRIYAKTGLRSKLELARALDGGTI